MAPAPLTVHPFEKIIQLAMGGPLGATVSYKHGDSELAKAFRDLTPGRRRGYVLHFTGAKQSKTRSARIEKCIPKILAGKGMHDREQ